jgi:hypothetical protein
MDEMMKNQLGLQWCNEFIRVVQKYSIFVNGVCYREFESVGKIRVGG